MRARSKIVTCLGLFLGLFSWVGLPHAAAEDASEKDASARQSADFMPRVHAFQEAMEAHGEPPVEVGPGRVLYTAWKTSLKSRSKRLVAKTRGIGRDSLWDLSEEEGAAVRIKPKQWGPAVRKFASLYTELGGGHKSYGKVRVSPDHAIRVWDKNHRAPRMTGLTPAGITLVGLRRRILYLRGQGLQIPWTLLREVDRYVILQSEEYELRRLAYRRWEEDRRQAHIDIRARYAETRVLIEAQREELLAEMKTLRELVADLQLVEEQRLRALVAAFPEGDPVHASARKYFQIMVPGRQRATRFTDQRTSRYGSLLNQKWTVPRKHLLTAIGKAEKRRTEAALSEEGSEEGVRKTAPADEAGTAAGAK